MHFVELGSGTTANFWLCELLESSKWHLESVALLLRRQQKGGLPIQDLDGCLHIAIFGSYYADPDELTEALILLIREGADVYAIDSGESVSDIACCTETIWKDGSMLSEHLYRGQGNRDLRLREIWMEALRACDYDAEEVISISMRVQELSDDGNESLSDQYEKSDSAESDRSEGDIENPTCLMSETCGPECHCQDDGMSRQTHSTLPSQYEQSLLEGDAQIWGS